MSIWTQNPAEKIDSTSLAMGRSISVDAPFVDGEDNSLLDVMTNEDFSNADNALMAESLSKEIERALSILTDREREIIRMFFGIGCPEATLEDIADKFGLTRERVRQIKERAIRRLRHNQNKSIREYIG